MGGGVGDTPGDTPGASGGWGAGGAVNDGAVLLGGVDGSFGFSAGLAG
jgi:hypothetical protein